MVSYNDSNYFTRVFKQLKVLHPPNIETKNAVEDKKVKLKIFRFGKFGQLTKICCRFQITLGLGVFNFI